MDLKDTIELPPSGVSPAGEPLDTGEAGEAEMDIEEEEEGLIREDLEQVEHISESESDGNSVGKSSLVQIGVAVTESAAISKNSDASSSGLAGENGFLASEDHVSLSNDTRCGKSLKRARVTYDEEEASVRVSYSSLTRSSKQKLEELMQQWSEWHAQHISSLQDSESEVLESGEQTFFPALHVGEKKQSAVSFWIDHQPGKLQSSGLILLDNDVPLYDRGYGLGLSSGDGSSNLEGGLEMTGDAARCFNCGSYSHSLKDCSKPRDRSAVNNARKQHMSKRNLAAASRSLTRYYEDAPAGKFDVLQPGCLDIETRKLLGIGELDPPPWLNRMRELGYPPGYLDPDDEDTESGITIFAEEETKADQEDGEILEENAEPPPPPQKKTSVEFPGINAPIPEDADPRQWAAGSSSSDPTRHRPRHHRSNQPAEPVTRSYSYHKEFYKDNPKETTSRSYSYHNEHYRLSGSGYSREDGRVEPVGRPYSFHYEHYRSLGKDRDDNNPPPPGTESGSHSKERYSSSSYDGGSSRPRSPDSYGRWEPT